MNILYGAVVVTRINTLRQQGVQLPPEALSVEPLEIDMIEGYLN
jgi:hypothetical protein